MAQLRPCHRAVWDYSRLENLAEEQTMRISSFAALRPKPELAARVAAVPYDVVNTEEARGLAAGNPLSFLHVSRSEIDLPRGADPYGAEVYQRALSNFRSLEREAL